MRDLRTVKMVFSNTNGVSRSIKFDFGSQGDAYWIFPETGYKVSFHKSGEVHIKNIRERLL